MSVRKQNFEQGGDHWILEGMSLEGLDANEVDSLENNDENISSDERRW